jgi:fructose-specific phosphotransferase system IIC component
MVILKHVQALYYHLVKAVLYMNTAVVGVGLFVYGEYTQVSYTLYCICGVEVLPKVTFMHIDSFNVNIIGRVIGTVQGTLTPWFRLIRSEGVATLLACALGTLTPRAALGTITPRVIRAGLIYTPQDEI